jgi:hypothetical protein
VRGAARLAFGASNTIMWAFPPETARLMATRLLAIAGEIEAREYGGPSRTAGDPRGPGPRGPGGPNSTGGSTNGRCEPGGPEERN